MILLRTKNLVSRNYDLHLALHILFILYVCPRCRGNVFAGKIVNKDDVHRIYDSVWYIESDDTSVYLDEEVKLYKYYCQSAVLEQRSNIHWWIRTTIVRQASASIDTFLYTCYLDFNLFSWIWYFGNHSFTILKSDFSMYLMPLWRRIGTCLWYRTHDIYPWMHFYIVIWTCLHILSFSDR